LSGDMAQITDSVYMVDSSYGNRKNVLSSYVIRGKEAAVIDPGPTASIEKLLKGLLQVGVDLGDVKHVIPTHVHLDHAGGSWRLLQYCKSAKLHVHPKGYSHLVEPSKLEQSARALLGKQVDEYGGIRGVPAEIVGQTSDSEVVDLGHGTEISVLWTPGHASHHQSIHVPGSRVIIAGDAAGTFSDSTRSVLPTAPPPFNPEQAISSIERLIGLAPAIVGYAHFGCTKDAARMLRVHKNQLEVWTKAAQDGLRDKKNLSEIYDELWKRDVMLQLSAPPRLVDTDTGERSPSISLRGFIEYVRWKQEQPQK